MSTLSLLGAAVSKLTGLSKDSSEGIRKDEIVPYLDMVGDFAESMKTAASDKNVSKAVSEMLSSTKLPDPGANIVKSAYLVYLKSLNTQLNTAEKASPLGSVVTVCGKITADVTMIRRKFAELFNGTDHADIPLDQLKVTATVALGYLEIASEYLRFATVVIGAVSGISIPTYRANSAMELAAPCARFANSLYVRPLSRTVIDDIEAMRRKGTDVYVVTDGKSVDEYASDSEYSPTDLANVNGFIRSPFLAIGQWFGSWRQNRYEKLKAEKEWMLNNVILIRSRMARMDPGSPEYERQEKIAQNYSDMISAADRKIAKYER